MNTSRALDRAGGWLLHSGIQSANGGVARFYRSDVQRNNPISTEITGYAASSFVYLHTVTGESEYLERAVHTARFLVECAWERTLATFPFEYPQSQHTYFFDCGIIIRGLLAVWRATREVKFRDAALACGHGMLKDFDSGSDFHPILRLPSKEPEARDWRWSRSSGCYQLKAALGWLELAEESGEELFRTAYHRMLEDSLSTHASFLPGHADGKRVMDRLHAYSYFLEGLLPCLSQQRVREALKTGIARAASLLQEIAPEFVRADVYAQLLRVKLFSGVGQDSAQADARSLASFQAASEDLRIDGGYYFGTEGGAVLPYVNPVSTAFGMQALEMWRQQEAGVLNLDRRLLI